MPRSSRAGLIVVVLAVVAAVAGWLWFARASAADQPDAATGMVRETEIHVAPEISGRLARLFVQTGQTVHRGDSLALLANPELWAAVGAARAAVDKAVADRDRVYAGVRDEEVQALQREILKAQATLIYAQQDLARKSALAARSDTSMQDLDKARAEAARAQADLTVAEARHAEALLGPTAEERALADATVAAAQAASAVIEARAAKMLLTAPADGVVGVIVAEVGEAIVPGEPVLTLLPAHGTWFGFNLREDQLPGLAIGSRVSLSIPGVSAPVAGTLTELRDWGEFATWRAARATNDHDLNTFFLRVDPDSGAAIPAQNGGRTVILLRSEPARQSRTAG